MTIMVRAFPWKWNGQRWCPGCFVINDSVDFYAALWWTHSNVGDYCHFILVSITKSKCWIWIMNSRCNLHHHILHEPPVSLSVLWTFWHHDFIIISCACRHGAQYRPHISATQLNRFTKSSSLHYSRHHISYPVSERRESGMEVCACAVVYGYSAGFFLRPRASERHTQPHLHLPGMQTSVIYTPNIVRTRKILPPIWKKVIWHTGIIKSILNEINHVYLGL